MRIFNADSPLMEGLSKITDLVILNLVVLVCCLPVITTGRGVFMCMGVEKRLSGPAAGLLFPKRVEGQLFPYLFSLRA